MENNELIKDKTWFQRYKWFFITVLVVIIGVVFLLMNSGKSLSDFSQAYADKSLYDEALQKASNNVKVIEVVGKLESIDNMTIAEGTVSYSDDKSTVTSTITIKGEKTKAKMDISAERNGTTWNYSEIKVRVKNPQSEIVVVDN